MKLLLVGASGLVGRHVLEAAINRAPGVHVVPSQRLDQLKR